MLKEEKQWAKFLGIVAGLIISALLFWMVYRAVMVLHAEHPASKMFEERNRR